jgi:transcriptional regulator with XRE-family HTH domain/tetratricopeptide (TPR) repeat protein
MNDQSNAFGSELRQARERAGMSLSAFAAQLHYSKGFLSKIENGHATPTPELARACDDLLSADGALVALAARGHRPRKSSALHGLPAGTRHFTGRQEELRRVGRALREPRAVVVLTGMAGVGKTELALRAAWEWQASFPDGCLFFDLHGHTPWASEVSSEEMLDALLRVLGVPGAEIPRDLDGRANVYRHRLRGKRLLLVLDNAAGSAQVWPLLPAEEGCRVIVTSRNRLTALDDAHHEIVGVLRTEEAVRLFRATAGDRVEDEYAVARLVGLCGNLPLAVRIAAARLRGGPGWTVEQLTARLLDEASRLRELYDGERNVTSAFALSLKSLSEPQQRLFGLLALHPGGDIELPAAAALGGHKPADAEHLLAGLDHAHLITQLPDDRIRLHDLLRRFAIEHVLPRIPPDQQKNAMHNLIDYVLRKVFSADELIAPHRFRPPLPPSDVTAEPFTDRATALAWLDREWPTLVTLNARAIARGLIDRCWLLPYLLHDYFFLTKLWEPWIESLEMTAAATRTFDERRALAMTLNNLGVAQADSGELAKSQRHYREALGLFLALGDEHGITTARSNLAWVDIYLGEHLAAVEGMTAALAAYRRAGADRNAAITLRGIALAEVELGRFDDALAHAEQARGEFIALNLDLDIVMTLNCLAWVHFRAGHATKAANLYQQAVEAGEQYGSRYEVARAQTGLGNVAAIRGELELADRYWSEADRFDGVLNPMMVGEARIRNDMAAHR